MRDIEPKSQIGKLFTHDYSKEKNLADVLGMHISRAEELLNAAMLVLSEGAEQEDGECCHFCSTAYEVLGAYKDAVRFSINGVELEQMRRSKVKAA